MALQTNSRVDWADIEAIYLRLNQVRSTFNFQEVATPVNQGTPVKPDEVGSLKTIIEGMKSNSYLSKIDTSSIVEPSKGSLLKVTPFSNITTVIETIENTCAYTECSFNSGNASFVPNSGFFSGNSGVCFFDFGCGSDVGDQGWQTGFYGWQTGDYGWQTGFYGFG